jgi:hypothetical protein
VTAAVAAGALAVAGHSLTANAAGSEHTPQAGAADYQEVNGIAPASLAGPAPAAAAPASEVMRLAPAADPAVELQALSRGADRADRAAREAHREALINRLGVPYQAGNNHSLDGWIAKALGVMGLPQALAKGVKQVILHESNGNPDAINNFDSNALAGHPSQGLMQTIPTTFKACVDPKLADRSITDPVANITAGVRSMIAHHGLETVLNGGRRDSNGNYLGYGGAGCSSYDLSEYQDELTDLWTDEPLPNV